MLISEQLKPELIKLDVKSNTKVELFEEMVDLFVAAGMLKDAEAAIDALIERENIMSTGIAPDFALPHGKINGVDGVIMALGVIKDGMEYDSLDGNPVHIVMVLFSERGNPGPHIEALSEISRLISIPQMLEKIKAATSPAQVLRILKDAEI